MTLNKIIWEELSYSCDLLKQLGGREEMRGHIQVDKDGEPRA